MGTTIREQQDKADEKLPLVGEGDVYPIYNVSWNEAVEFCRKLSEKEHRHYRLPTEAEWEYACRAGTHTAYWSGDGEDALARVAWYTKNSGQDGSHPVGEKPANPFGLYDMHGNVFQWCSDVRAPYEGVVTDPAGPESNADHSSRVVRGGAWVAGAGTCRAAFRLGSAPSVRNPFAGFRVALDF